MAKLKVYSRVGTLINCEALAMAASCCNCFKIAALVSGLEKPVLLFIASIVVM